MIIFAHLVSWLEQSFLEMKEVYNGVDKLDIQNGGESFLYNQALEVIKNTSAQDCIKQDEIIDCENMKQYIHQLLNAVYSYSNLVEKYGKNSVECPFVTIKINKKSYGKQKLFITILNTITEEKWNLKLFDEII